MNGRTAKSDRRKVRKVLGDGAPILLEAHEDGLKTHGEILRRTVLAGFWGRMRWLFFGIPTENRWQALSSAMRTLKPGPPVLERSDA